MKRHISSFVRNREYFITTNLQMIFPALLAIGIFFQIKNNGFDAVQDRIGFVGYIGAGQLATYSAITVFFQCLNSIRRERFSSMARSASHYWALLLIQFPLWMALMAILNIIQYYVCGLRYTPFTAFLVFLSLKALSIIQCLAVGIVIASLTPNLQTGLIVGAFYILLCSAFNGSLVNTNNISWVLRWLRYLSNFYYLTVGLNQNEFLGQIINGQPGEFWIEQYGLDGITVMWCAGALMIFLVLTLAAGQFFFERRTRPPILR